MMRRLVLIGLSMAVASTCLFAQASLSPAEAEGLRIAKEVDRRDSGFQDFVVDMEMVLTNRYGQESGRQLRLKTLEVEGDGDKSMSIFDSPRDVKGTALLSFTHKVGPDDQWLYLPALKRVKRIASNNRSGPFMGSEFAYEDITSQEVEKYTYKYIETITEEKQSFYVVERYPVDKNSGYSKQIAYFDTEHYRPFKIVYFDRKGAKLKTQIFSGHTYYFGTIWRPDAISMTNHLTGKSTTLYWKNYRFKTGLKDSDFSRNALKRAK